MRPHYARRAIAITTNDVPSGRLRQYVKYIIASVCQERKGSSGAFGLVIMSDIVYNNVIQRRTERRDDIRKKSKER
jgi:hypothetical protein